VRQYRDHVAQAGGNLAASILVILFGASLFL